MESEQSSSPQDTGGTEPDATAPPGAAAESVELSTEDADAAPIPTTVPTTRAGRLWVALILGVLLLIVILVFIFQNLQDVKVSFFAASGSLPLALALLFAAVLGALIVLTLGSVRIVQLRRAVKRRSRAANKG